MNLQQAIDGFFLIRRSELAATTQQNYRYYFNKLLGYLGAERPLQEISTAEIRAYLKHLRDSGMSERTVHDHWIACSSLRSFAAAELGAGHNLLYSVRRFVGKLISESYLLIGQRYLFIVRLLCYPLT